MSTDTVEVPRDLLEALYTRNYNPVISYRDPEGSALWERLAPFIGTICLCGEDGGDPATALQHKSWCPKADE